MQLPLQITIRDPLNSEALKAHIEKKSQKLEQYFDHIIACKIVVEETQKNHLHGNLYNVTIDITVPREQIVVSRVKRENPYIALRDAFTAAQRKLRNHALKVQGKVKNHKVNEQRKLRSQEGVEARA